MEIFINDTKADITLENEKTVEDILKAALKMMMF